MHPNKVDQFYSDRGKNHHGHQYSTSKYYVYTNGVIRASFAKDTLYVDLGKNICFIVAEDGTKVTRTGRTGFKVGDDEEITFADAMKSGSSYQKRKNGKWAVDFYLTSDGTYQHGGAFHYGHPITGKFQAVIGDTPVSEKSFDRYIKATFVNPKNSKELLGTLTPKTILTMQPYVDWLKHH